jgi:hypothetical protein
LILKMLGKESGLDVIVVLEDGVSGGLDHEGEDGGEHFRLVSIWQVQQRSNPGFGRNEFARGKLLAFYI